MWNRKTLTLGKDSHSDTWDLKHHWTHENASKLEARTQQEAERLQQPT